MRSGSTTGSRVCMRTRRTCGIASRPARRPASRRSLRVSGWPPLSRTSVTLESARIDSSALPKAFRPACCSPYGNLRRKQSRQWMAQARHVTARHSQRKPCRCTTGRLDPCLSQSEAIRQFPRVADAVPQGLLPGGWGEVTDEGGCGYHTRLATGSPPLSVPAAPGSNASANRIRQAQHTHVHLQHERIQVRPQDHARR
jgi:hypothetical protein